ncbi:MAG TPA: hypothetical protein ENK06_01280 [Gammaproteobacteria bacterium]|nr:hypothetical protein [Gammaproteobacteria bacterium]
MNKQLQENSEENFESELETEITLENIIDLSPSERKRRITGVITTKLNYDAATKRYFIKNPLSTDEHIFVWKTIIDISESEVGSDVLLMFEENDVYKPVITGVVKSLQAAERKTADILDKPHKFKTSIDDSERLVFSAEREIVLQCGKSSIHLTRAGKIIIRGSYVLSRSTGVNSLKGAAVSIN